MSGCRTELSALTSMPLSTSRSTAPRLPNCAAAKSSSGPGFCSGRIFCSLRFFAAAVLEDMDRAVRGGCAGDGAPCVGRMRSARPGQKQSGKGAGRSGQGPARAPLLVLVQVRRRKVVDKRPQRAAPQVGAKVVQIPGQKVSVSCAARTAPAHDARARLATWPLRGGKCQNTGTVSRA